MKQETLEEAADRLFKTHSNNTSLAEGHYDYMMDKEDFKEASLEIAKWQQERMLKFILDEDNHTEGELGNSCIDVQTLVHFIEQFKKK